MAEVDIRVNSKADLKGFKQAETAAMKLQKSVKKLAGAFGLAYGASAVINYGKASIKAFAADDKAAKILSRTLNNLGLAFADPEVKNFIATLEKQYGVLDDQLRPAYQKLITTTGDYKKSQRLLKTALDLSALSGENVVSVADDLARAYVGNTKGLQKYGLGLTKAQLAAMSFADILKRIAIISDGQASLAADTYSGKLDKLTVASANAKEVLGGALLDALIKLGGGDVDKATSKIDKLSLALADLIRLATGTSAMSLKDIFAGVDFKYGFIPVNKRKVARSASPAGTFKNQQASNLARANAIKQEKALAALAKSQAASAADILKKKQLGLAIDKANLALGKGSDVFNMDAIQVNAALISQAEQLGKATTSAQLLAIANDVARLNVKKSMYELEQAIASGDIKAIEAATTKLNKDVEILGALQNQKYTVTQIADILNALKPKELIDIANLQLALSLLSQLKIPSLNVPGASAATSGVSSAATVMGTGGAATYASVAIKEASDAVTYFSQVVTDAFQTIDDSVAKNSLINLAASGIIGNFNPGSLKGSEGSISTFSGGGAYDRGGTTVNVTVQGSVLSEQDLVQVVQNAVQANNRYGNNLNVAGSL
jgi:hypothetical protein